MVAGVLPLRLGAMAERRGGRKGRRGGRKRKGCRMEHPFAMEV